MITRWRGPLAGTAGRYQITFTDLLCGYRQLFTRELIVCLLLFTISYPQIFAADRFLIIRMPQSFVSCDHQ